MIPLKLKQIAEFCGGELKGDGDTVITAVTKNSRETPSDSLYIALKGDRFDGNDFIEGALSGGCAAALGEVCGNFAKPYIRVSDTKCALMNIAKGYKAMFSVPTVAITGSVGKTTTKEIVASVLSEKYKTLKTEGNFNNEIGMPLMALRLDESHEAAVFEMGMSGFGEISNMTNIAKPDMAVISNIGMSHIGKLGSRENILKAKLEITEGLADGGVLAVNGDDEFLSKIDLPCVKYGLGEGCDVRGINVKEDSFGCSFEAELCGKMYSIRVNIPGKHNVYNALAAAVVGLNFGVEPEKIVSGIAKAGAVGNRMRILDCGGVKLISDCYNASPDSVRAALDVLKSCDGRRIAVLADMLEMGDFSKPAHVEAGKAASFADVVVTVGELGRFIAEGAEKNGAARVCSFDKNSDVCGFLKECLKPGDVVLVKGSNGMKLSEICDFIEVNYK